MIEMIAGVFGLPVGGIVEAMDKKSGPFKASAEQEARLVKLGLAKYVDEPVQAQETAPAAPVGEAATGIPAYSVNMKSAELRKIGEMCGLTFKAGMSKAEMVAKLDAHIADHMVNGVEVDENGEITVDDGEPEPTFDASQAVL